MPDFPPVLVFCVQLEQALRSSRPVKRPDRVIGRSAGAVSRSGISSIIRRRNPFRLFSQLTHCRRACLADSTRVAPMRARPWRRAGGVHLNHHPPGHGSDAVQDALPPCPARRARSGSGGAFGRHSSLIAVGATCMAAFHEVPSRRGHVVQQWLCCSSATQWQELLRDHQQAWL